MTIITFHTSIDPDVIKKYKIYDAGERQFDFYVMSYLNSPDGWAQYGFFFEPKEKAIARVMIRLSSHKTISQICGLGEKLSCAVLGGRDMYLCAERWFDGAPKSKLNLDDYRQYMVSHEIGHILGYEHKKCPCKGCAAPVMMQQTLGIDDCHPNTKVSLSK